MEIPIKEYLRLLSKYLKSQKKRVVLLSLVLLSHIVLQLISPQIVSYFIDAVSKGTNIKNLTIAGVLFIAVAFAKQGFNIAEKYLSQNIGWLATNALKTDLIKHCVGLDMSFHKSLRPGELIERIDGDVSKLFEFFSDIIINIINNMILLIGILVLLYRVDVRVGVTFTVFSGFVVLVLMYAQSRVKDYWVKDQEMSASFFGFLEETISSTEDLSANGSKAYIMEKFYNYLKERLPLRVKAVMNTQNIFTFSVLTTTIGTITAIGLASYLFTRGDITIGTVYLIINYTELLIRPINIVRGKLQNMQKAKASITRIKELFDVKASIISGNNKLPSKEALSIKLSKISFEYEENVPVLKDVSIDLPKGKILGVLGRTGSGKTTLARLLVRLYDVSKGELLIEGQNIRTISTDSLRKEVAYVTQDVQLFNASVRDNLTLFNNNIEDSAILEVIQELGLGDWFNQLPNGLDTLLEPKGNGLSAGEAQLLAFVRVFLKDPGILILDEASSRLDPITEQLVERALDKLIKDRTCIIIAHRLTTVTRAHNILILENGSIVEYGEREKLMEDEESRFHGLLNKGLVEVLA